MITIWGLFLKNWILVASKEHVLISIRYGFLPHKRNIQYQEDQPVPIKPLISQLEFIKDKRRWGYQFRWGAFEISQSDFELIKHSMSKEDSDVK